MYSTVKYTDESIDSCKEKLEWKIRIQHAPYSLDLAPFDFTSFTQLKSDLHGKRFKIVICMNYAQNLVLKETWFGDIYGNLVQRHRKCVKHQGG